MQHKKSIKINVFFLCLLFFNLNYIQWVNSTNFNGSQTLLNNFELIYGLESYVLNENGTIIVDTFEKTENNLSKIIQSDGYESILSLSSFRLEFKRYNQTDFKVEINLVLFNYSWSGFLFYNENEKYFSTGSSGIPIYCPLMVNFDQLKTTRSFATSINEEYVEVYKSGAYIEISGVFPTQSPTPTISQILNLRNIKCYQDSDHRVLLSSLNYEAETGILIHGRLPGNNFGSLLQALVRNQSSYASNPNLFLFSTSLSFNSPGSDSFSLQIILFIGLFFGLPLGFTIMFIKRKKKK